MANYVCMYVNDAEYLHVETQIACQYTQGRNFQLEE